MAFSSTTMNICICQYSNCTELKITDNCTEYDTDLKINGDAVTAAILTIDGVDYDVFSLFSIAVDQDDLVYSSEDVLDGISVSDGLHTIVYTLTAGGIDYVMLEKTVYYICNIECCVWSMLQKIYQYYDCNNCKNEYILNALTAYTLLKSLRYAMSCGNLNSAAEIYSLISTICDAENCNCN